MASTKPSGESRLTHYDDFLLSLSLGPGTGCCIGHGAKGWNGHRAVDTFWSFPCGLSTHGSSSIRKTTSYRCRHQTGETIINDDNHHYKNKNNDELRISSSPILSQYPTLHCSNPYTTPNPSPNYFLNLHLPLPKAFSNSIPNRNDYYQAMEACAHFFNPSD